MPLAHIDPTARRSALYRGYARLAGTRPMGRLSKLLLWKLDPILMRLSRGRVRMGWPLPTALLETRGARSGRPRRNPVIYFHDGDQVVIVASKLGLPEHPAWFHNVRAHPEVHLNGVPFVAEVVQDEEARARLWRLAYRVFPPYASYRERAARTRREIPILVLRPR